MKKFFRNGAAVTATTMMFLGLAACSSGGALESYTFTTEQNGLNEVLVLDARGDTVEKLTSTVTVDLSGEGGDLIADQLDALDDTIEEELADVPGATFTSEMTDESFEMMITADLTSEENIDALAATGIIPITSGADEISLEQSRQGLLDEGYTEVTD